MNKSQMLVTLKILTIGTHDHLRNGRRRGIGDGEQSRSTSFSGFLTPSLILSRLFFSVWAPSVDYFLCSNASDWLEKKRWASQNGDCFVLQMSLHKSYFLQVHLCLYSQEILSHHNLNVTYQHRLALEMLVLWEHWCVGCDISVSASALWEHWCVGGEGSGDLWSSAPLPRTASRLHPHCSARRGRTSREQSEVILLQSLLKSNS